MKNFLKLIRVPQWVKNLFVFIPIFFAGEINDEQKLWQTIVAFFIFCFISSAVYILNDYVDRDKDKLHPEKKKRPIASGAVSKNQAIAYFFLMIALAIAGLTYLDNYKVDVLIGIYFVMNIAYTFKLKNIAIIDVLIISFGFLLRVLVGGYASGIIVTSWTQVLVFCLALILAMGKRRGEIVNADLKGETRKSLDGYNLEFVNFALVMACTINIVAYLMFCLSSQAQEHFHHYIFYTFIFVIAGILRYLQQTFVYNDTESPTKMIFKDRFLQVDMLLFVASFVFLIYLKN